MKNGTFQLFQKIIDITSNVRINILEKQFKRSSVPFIKGMIWKKVLEPSPALKNAYTGKAASGRKHMLRNGPCKLQLRIREEGKGGDSSHWLRLGS